MHFPVVENDPTVADVLGMTLEEAGYFKTTANTIETALFELKHNQIDAVLLDINLPDGDGTRLALLIRKIAEDGKNGVVIDTIWGQGYILREVRDYDTMNISA